MLSPNCKSVIFEFVSTRCLILKISKLSKRDRKNLLTKDHTIIDKRGILCISALFADHTMSENEYHFRKSLEYLVQITNGVCLDLHQKPGVGRELFMVEDAAHRFGKKMMICKPAICCCNTGNRNRVIEAQLYSDADFAQLERVSSTIITQHFKKLDLYVNSEAQILNLLSTN